MEIWGSIAFFRQIGVDAIHMLGSVFVLLMTDTEKIHMSSKSVAVAGISLQTLVGSSLLRLNAHPSNFT